MSRTKSTAQLVSLALNYALNRSAIVNVSTRHPIEMIGIRHTLSTRSGLRSLDRVRLISPRGMSQVSLQEHMANHVVDRPVNDIQPTVEQELQRPSRQQQTDYHDQQHPYWNELQILRRGVYGRDKSNVIPRQELKRILQAVDKVVESKVLETDPRYSTDLIGLTARYLVTLGGNNNIRRAHRLFWHMVDNKEKFFSASNSRNFSRHICDTFHVLATFNMIQGDYQDAYRMSDAIQQLASSEPKFLLMRFAINTILELYNTSGQFSRALYWLDYVVERSKRGDLLTRPNIFSFNMVLEVCPARTAITIVNDMVKLCQQGPIFPRPNQYTVILGLDAIARHPHPWAGEQAEKFLMWSFSCHKKGLMDLSNFRMNRATVEVLKAWSISDSPRSGRRADILMDFILDQYQKDNGDKPAPSCFAFNATAWIRSGKFLKPGDEPISQKVMNVLNRMVPFGQQEKWTEYEYRPNYFLILEALASARMEGRKKDLDTILEMIVPQMQSLGLSLEWYVQHFPMLQDFRSEKIEKAPSPASGSEFDLFPAQDDTRNNVLEKDVHEKLKQKVESTEVESRGEDDNLTLHDPPLRMTFTVKNLNVALERTGEGNKSDDDDDVVETDLVRFQSDDDSSIIDLRNFTGRVRIQPIPSSELKASTHQPKSMG